MATFNFPEEWSTTLDEIALSEGKVIFVLGDVDVGKSTFTFLLAKKLTESGERVGIVDADIGQSDIGPPTTIGLGIVEGEMKEFESIEAAHLYFVGSISPEGHLLPMVVGTKKMVERALEIGVSRVIIDTTGLVRGSVGYALKTYKIEIISPHHIVAIQKRGELEHILRHFEGIKKIHRIPSPPGIIPRGREERRERRFKKLQSYFEKSKLHQLSFSQIRTSETPFLSGRILSEREREILSDKAGELILHGEYREGALYLVVENKIPKETLWRISGGKEIIQNTPTDLKDILIGLLNKGREVISIGVITDVNFFEKKILLRAPINSASEVEELRFSDFKVKL